MRTVTRYHTKEKRLAFRFLDEKNRSAGNNIWRVAAKVRNRIIFDIDNFDHKNARTIYDYYKNLFCYDFRIIQTTHGYHFISKPKYKDNLEWQYDTCRVLYPILEKKDMQKYIEELSKFYKSERDQQKIDGKERNEFLEYLPQKLKLSGLYCGIGNFDMLFALNVIMKGYYCLRISKKGINDKPFEVQL